MSELLWHVNYISIKHFKKVADKRNWARTWKLSILPTFGKSQNTLKFTLQNG